MVLFGYLELSQALTKSIMVHYLQNGFNCWYCKQNVELGDNSMTNGLVKTLTKKTERNPV